MYQPRTVNIYLSPGLYPGRHALTKAVRPPRYGPIVEVAYRSWNWVAHRHWRARNSRDSKPITHTYTDFQLPPVSAVSHSTASTDTGTNWNLLPRFCSLLGHHAGCRSCRVSVIVHWRSMWSISILSVVVRRVVSRIIWVFNRARIIPLLRLCLRLCKPQGMSP